VLDGDVDVGRSPDAAVDVVEALQPGRLVEAGEGGRRLHRLGDRERGVLVVAEDDALGRVEVHRDDVELDPAQPVQHAEVVRHAAALDVVAEVLLEARVVEEARRQIGEREGELARPADGVDDGLHALDEVRERRPLAARGRPVAEAPEAGRRAADEVAEQVREVGEQVDDELERLRDELRQVQAVEVERREVRELVGAAVERAQHLGRGDAAASGAARNAPADRPT
jgi:hypothetical protein